MANTSKQSVNTDILCLEQSFLSKLISLKSIYSYRIVFLLLERMFCSRNYLVKELKKSEKEVELMCHKLYVQGILFRYVDKEDTSSIFYVMCHDFDIVEKCNNCSNCYEKNGILKCNYHEDCIYNYFRRLRNIKKKISKKCVRKDYEILSGRMENKYKDIDVWSETDFIKHFEEKFREYNSGLIIPDRYVIKNSIKKCSRNIKSYIGPNWRRACKRFITDIISTKRGYDSFNYLCDYRELQKFLKENKIKFIEACFCPKEKIFCSYYRGSCVLLESNILCEEDIKSYMKEKFN